MKRLDFDNAKVINLPLVDLVILKIVHDNPGIDEDGILSEVLKAGEELRSMTP
tara:strand:+ start:105 stop:263 length:159 start_codon:yes stop_codon:yes gene_type:complete